MFPYRNLFQLAPSLLLSLFFIASQRATPEAPAAPQQVARQGNGQSTKKPADKPEPKPTVVVPPALVIAKEVDIPLRPATGRNEGRKLVLNESSGLASVSDIQVEVLDLVDERSRPAGYEGFNSPKVTITNVTGGTPRSSTAGVALGKGAFGRYIVDVKAPLAPGTYKGTLLLRSAKAGIVSKIDLTVLSVLKSSWIIWISILGIGMGALLRHGLAAQLTLQEARVDAARLLNRIHETERRYLGYEGWSALGTLKNEVRSATESGRQVLINVLIGLPLGGSLASQVTAFGVRLDAAIKTMEEKRAADWKEVSQRYDDLLTLSSGRWFLPPRVNQALATLNSELKELQPVRVASDFNGLKSPLDAIWQRVAGSDSQSDPEFDLGRLADSWLDEAQELLTRLKNSPGLQQEIVSDFLAAISSFEQQLQNSPKAPRLFLKVAEVTTFLENLNNNRWQLRRWVLYLHSTWGLAANRLVEDCEKQLPAGKERDQLIRAIRASASPIISQSLQKMDEEAQPLETIVKAFLTELEKLPHLWKLAFASALQGYPSAVVLAIDTSVNNRNFYAALEEYAQARLNAVAPDGTHPATAHQEGLAQLKESIDQLKTYYPTSDTLRAKLAQPKTPTPDDPAKPGKEEVAHDRAENSAEQWKQLVMLSVLRTALIGFVIVALGYLFFSPSFIGGPQDLAKVFFWGFTLDLTFDSLKNVTTPLATSRTIT
jgi:hypothetical protein